MNYETFNPEIHDARKAAELIYDVDFRTYNMLFKTKTDAVNTIHKNLKKEECLKIILKNNEIIGIIMYYTKEKYPEFHFKNIKLHIIDILDFFVLAKIKKDDLYIAELAIDRPHQKKGLGSAVLNDMINYGRENNYKRIVLDVDLRNTGAKRLYEKIGFKTFNKKELRLIKRGMYNMAMKL